MIATYSNLLIVIFWVLNFELLIETQFGLLEEIIWVLELDPLMTLYYWMGKSFGGLLAQNH